MRSCIWLCLPPSFLGAPDCRSLTLAGQALRALVTATPPPPPKIPTVVLNSVAPAMLLAPLAPGESSAALAGGDEDTPLPLSHFHFPHVTLCVAHPCSDLPFFFSFLYFAPPCKYQGGIFELGDRVVCVAASAGAPFGLKGAVVGIHSSG